jgi:hypothetical protein
MSKNNLIKLLKINLLKALLEFNQVVIAEFINDC